MNNNSKNNHDDFKLTNQRVAIINFLKKNYSHPSVEEIYLAISKTLPRTSKKTVYSALNFLVKKGLITEVDIKGVFRYEPKEKLHHHVVCDKCKKIIDFNSEELEKNILKNAKKINEFSVINASVVFHGICKNCKRDKNGYL